MMERVYNKKTQHENKKRENFLGDFMTHSLEVGVQRTLSHQAGEGGVVVRDLFHPVLLEGYVTHCLIRNSLSLLPSSYRSEIHRESAVR